MLALELDKLSFGYETGYDSYLNVFDELSLKFVSGDIIGLIGLNGTGKSTFLKLLKGILKPQKGDINVKINERAIKSNNFYVPLVSQDVNQNLFPSFTVYENYCLSKNRDDSFFLRYSSKESYSACLKMLCKAEMGLDKKINEQSRFLSGGQKQALSILLALENNYPILLMDEPTASLDPFVSTKILSFTIQEIIAKKGLLFFASHNMRDIVKYSNKVMVLSDHAVTVITNDGNNTEDSLMLLMRD